VRPPTHKGFGTVVLEEAMTEHFDAPHIDFSITGVTYELHGRLDGITSDEIGSDATSPMNLPGGTLACHRIHQDGSPADRT
jgi:hypothetical protein